MTLSRQSNKYTLKQLIILNNKKYLRVVLFSKRFVLSIYNSSRVARLINSLMKFIDIKTSKKNEQSVYYDNN